MNQKMLFIGQVRLRSLVSRSESYKKMIDFFVCSCHAMKLANLTQGEQEYMLKRDIAPPIRHRADQEQIKHFVN